LRLLADIYEDLKPAEANLLTKGEAIGALTKTDQGFLLSWREKGVSDRDFRRHPQVRCADLLFTHELKVLTGFVLDKVEQIDGLLKMLISITDKTINEGKLEGMCFLAGVQTIVDRVAALSERMGALEASASAALAELHREIASKDAALAAKDVALADKNELYDGLVVMLDTLLHDKLTEEQFATLGRIIIEKSIRAKIDAFEARLPSLSDARCARSLPLPNFNPKATLDMRREKPDKIDAPASRRDPPVLTLADLERRIVTTIAEDLAKLRARIDAAEARATARERERTKERTCQSAIDRAHARWFN
jgi:hypothetical protein